MPTVPEITPMPKNSSRVSTVDRCASPGPATYQIIQNNRPNCSGAQIRVIALYHVSLPSSVEGSALSRLRPRIASRIEKKYQVTSGSKSTVQPPCSAPIMASGTSTSDSQNGRARRTCATLSAGRVRNVVMHRLPSWHEILGLVTMQLLFQTWPGKVKHLAHHCGQIRRAKRRGREEAGPQRGCVL